MNIAVVLVAGGVGLAFTCVGKLGVQLFETSAGDGGVRFALFDKQYDALEVAGEGGVLVGDGGVGFGVAGVEAGSDAVG